MKLKAKFNTGWSGSNFYMFGEGEFPMNNSIFIQGKRYLLYNNRHKQIVLNNKPLTPYITFLIFQEEVGFNTETHKHQPFYRFYQGPFVQNELYKLSLTSKVLHLTTEEERLSQLLIFVQDAESN